jgi:predicted RNase H-like HicB family nuclease
LIGRLTLKVREVIRSIEEDGWFQVAMHAEQHPETGRSQGATVLRYAIVIEKAEGNYSAYVPDLPGCVATGATVPAVEEGIREAIRFHIEGLKEDGLPVPAPTSIANYVET